MINQIVRVERIAVFEREWGGVVQFLFLKDWIQWQKVPLPTKTTAASNAKIFAVHS